MSILRYGVYTARQSSSSLFKFGSNNNYIMVHHKTQHKIHFIYTTKCVATALIAGISYTSAIARSGKTGLQAIHNHSNRESRIRG